MDDTAWMVCLGLALGPPQVHQVPPILELEGDDGDDYDGVGLRLLWSKPPHSTAMGSHPCWRWMDGWGGSEAAMEQTSP